MRFRAWSCALLSIYKKVEDLLLLLQSALQRHERTPAAEGGTRARNCRDFCRKWRLPRHFGFFYMPQIYDMWPTALLPLRRKACWGIFSPEKSDGFSRVWTRELGYQRPARLPLDHRSRCWRSTMTNETTFFYKVKTNACTVCYSWSKDVMRPDFLPKF